MMPYLRDAISTLMVCLLRFRYYAYYAITLIIAAVTLLPPPPLLTLSPLLLIRH